MESSNIYQGRTTMDTEVTQIMQHIHEGHHFLLSGGAGSGKTYTLVQVIKQIIAKEPTSLIACVTYTNAAVHEIEERVNHDNLRVSTIHDFLWDCVCNFQNELRESLVELVNREQIKISSDVNIPINIDFFAGVDNIQYKEYLRVGEGIISHDEVLKLAKHMFTNYPKLRAVTKGTYPFILIDEYQDTSPLVIETLLESFDDGGRPCCIGLFGDSMQAIYDDGIGDIDRYKYPDGKVYEVKKEQNRRSPQVVINLANKIRLDDLEQRPSEDKGAPNMVEEHVKRGAAIFLYSLDDTKTVSNVRSYLSETEGWDFGDTQKVKELNLTHNLIAEKAGFPILMEIHRGDGILKYRDRVNKFIKEHCINTEGKSFGLVLQELEDTYVEMKDRKPFLPTRDMQSFIENHSELYSRALTFNYDDFVKMYVSSDQLVDDKKQAEDEISRTGSRRSELVKHLMKIEQCIHLYSTGMVSDFLKSTEMKIKSLADKRSLRNAIDQLINVKDKSIKDIIDSADELGIVKKDESLERYQKRYPYIYERVMGTPYKEVQALYRYLEGMTPFSTQHKTKGSEFDNVLVILDNGKWNNYNFEKLFTASEEEMNDSVVRRTRKIFYVCCTRTKENLAVYYHQPSESVLTKAREWFGTENVLSIG